MAKTYDELLTAVQEAVAAKSGDNGTEDVTNITEAYAEYLQEEYLELMTEGVLSNPLKKHIEKLKDIKKKKPAEYDGPEEVKKFVDENFDDIQKAADLLEKEPEDLRINQIKYLAGILVSYIAWFAVALSASEVFIAMATILLLVTMFVPLIINYCRRCSDVKAMDELTKIKNALKKVDTKKLPTPMRKKILDLITKINDAETEIRATMKMTKESAEEDLDAQLAIYESARAGEITEEERDYMLESLNVGGG